MTTNESTNIMPSHGHVTPNPSGVKARCGGPAVCPVCAKELAQKNKRELPGPQREESANAILELGESLCRMIEALLDRNARLEKTLAKYRETDNIRAQFDEESG